MRYRVLGRTGLTVSELGFGCSAFWARRAFPERKAIAVLERAIDRGITFLDTGPSYAAGNAERRLGIVLRACDTKDLVICSKVGTYIDDDGRAYKDWSPAVLKSSVRRSLERLGVDRLSVLFLHAPGIADLSPPLIEALADLRTEGLVGSFGINSFDRDVVRQALTIPPFDSFMIEYNIIRKGNAALLDDIAAAGAGAVVATPVAQGLFRPSMWPTSVKRAWELGRALQHHRNDLLAARRYRFLNELPQMTGAQAALAFTLLARNSATTVFTTTSTAHLEMNLAAAEIELPADLVRQIEALPDGEWGGSQSLLTIAKALF